MIERIWEWFVLIVSVGLAVMFVGIGPAAIVRSKWRAWRQKSRRTF